MFEPGKGGSSVEVTSEDGRALDELGPAPRLRLAGIEKERLPELFLGLRLFEGELSSYAKGRLLDGEVIKSLLDREIPLSVWMDGGELVAVPARFLDAEKSYTLAASGEGPLGSLKISGSPFRRLRLVWPSWIGDGGTLVYCHDAPQGHVLLEEPMAVTLGPNDDEATVRSGVGAEGIEGARCLSVEVVGLLEAEFVVPPASLGEADSAAPLVLEPIPLPVVRLPEAPPRESAACDTPLGPACARFVGDELVLERASPGAWALRGVATEGGLVESVLLAPEGGRLSLHGFAANTAYRLSLSHVDPWGRVTSANATLESGAALPRVVINEILANARGPEPASEWIELLNAGSESAILSGWSLEDGGGITALPDVVLEPGEYGLVVGADYVPSGDDVVPSARALPLVVPRVGKNGLSNSGEALRLRNAEGEVVSSAPALAASAAGVSMARRDPWAPDVAESFGAHASPGASPGAPNLLKGE